MKWTLVILCAAIAVLALLSRRVHRDDGLDQEAASQAGESDVGGKNDDELSGGMSLRRRLLGESDVGGKNDKLIKIRGRVVEGPRKGYHGGPNVVVQVIEGRLTQEYIRRPLRAEPDLPAEAKFEIGATYEFLGYKRGKYDGQGPLMLPTVPHDSFGPAPTSPDHNPPPVVPGSQSSFGRFFMPYFGVVDLKRIDPVRFTPADFVDREALLEGRATSKQGRGFLHEGEWDLLVRDGAAWPDWMEDKMVEAFGIVRRTGEHMWHVEKAVSRLVKLEDQIGREVELRGTAWSLNGDWWFSYRGENCYVEGLQESQPWKNGIRHGEPMVVRGVLQTAKVPPPYQQRSAESARPKRDWPEQYIVRHASWEPVEKLLSPEHDNKPH